MACLEATMSQICSLSMFIISPTEEQDKTYPSTWPCLAEDLDFERSGPFVLLLMRLCMRGSLRYIWYTE